MEEKKIPKNIADFLTLITKLEVGEVIGVCRILNIKLIDENNEPRQGEDLIVEVASKYASLNYTQRRNLKAIVEAAASKPEKQKQKKKKKKKGK